MEPIEDMRITDYSNDTVEPELKKFLINFERVGTNSCLIVDYGVRHDFSDAYGSAENCKELFSNSKFIMAGNLTNPLEISRRYSKPRDYVININVANQISKQSFEFTVTVIGKFMLKATFLKMVTCHLYTNRN